MTDAAQAPNSRRLGLLGYARLEAPLRTQPPDVKEEVLRINDHARNHALQAVLLVPLPTGVLGIADASRMGRRPDPKPSASAELS